MKSSKVRARELSDIDHHRYLQLSVCDFIVVTRVALVRTKCRVMDLGRLSLSRVNHQVVQVLADDVHEKVRGTLKGGCLDSNPDRMEPGNLSTM